jgi:hypothetical protein
MAATKKTGLGYKPQTSNNAERGYKPLTEGYKPQGNGHVPTSVPPLPSGVVPASQGSSTSGSSKPSNSQK